MSYYQDANFMFLLRPTGMSLWLPRNASKQLCLQGKGAPLMLSSIFEAVMRALHCMLQWLWPPLTLMPFQHVVLQCPWLWLSLSAPCVGLVEPLDSSQTSLRPVILLIATVSPGIPDIVVTRREKQARIPELARCHAKVLYAVRSNSVWSAQSVLGVHPWSGFACQMSGEDGIINVSYIIVMHSVHFKARGENEQDKLVQFTSV